MAKILSDSNTGTPTKYITKQGSHKIIPRGTKEYFIRCPQKDCRAEIDLRELNKYVGLSSSGESCPYCNRAL